MVRQHDYRSYFEWISLSRFFESASQSVNVIDEQGATPFE
jgi:hypothetical protein